MWWLQTSLSVRKILDSIPGPVIPNTVSNSSPPLRRFCVAQAQSRGGGRGPDHSLHQGLGILFTVNPKAISENVMFTEGRGLHCKTNTAFNEQSQQVGY